MSSTPRSGIEVADLLVTMRPAGRHRAATSYKPFLQHIASGKPERTRTISLKADRRRPRVLTAAQAQEILDACEHLRDRLLFALLLDTGVRIGEALGLRHDDIAICAANALPVAGVRGAQPTAMPTARRPGHGSMWASAGTVAIIQYGTLQD
jgi:site-specific recombinase XerD